MYKRIATSTVEEHFTEKPTVEKVMEIEGFAEISAITYGGKPSPIFLPSISKYIAVFSNKFSNVSQATICNFYMLHFRKSICYDVHLKTKVF